MPISPTSSRGGCGEKPTADKHNLPHGVGKWGKWSSPVKTPRRAPPGVCPELGSSEQLQTSPREPDPSQHLLLPRWGHAGCPALPCLRPAVCGVRRMPLGVCIPREAWWEPWARPLRQRRARGSFSPQPPACPHLSAPTRFSSPPRKPAGPRLTRYFLIARKWLIPPGLVSMDVEIPRLWPPTSFSSSG